MSIKHFRHVHTTDRNLNTVQENVAATFKSFIKNPLLEGKIIEVALASGDNVVNHGLDKPYSGYVMVETDTVVDVKTSSATNSQKDRQIIINASAAANIKLLVF